MQSNGESQENLVEKIQAAEEASGSVVDWAIQQMIAREADQRTWEGADSYDYMMSRAGEPGYVDMSPEISWAGFEETHAEAERELAMYGQLYPPDED